MAARPPRLRSHSDAAAREFVVWVEWPAGTWIHLPCFFAELPVGGFDGLWPQADGSSSKASWVEVEVTAAGNVFLNREWQAFVRARGLQGGILSTSSTVGFRALRRPKKGSNSGTCVKNSNYPAYQSVAPRPSSIRVSKEMNTTVSQVWAILRCKTLLLLCGGLALRGAEGELVQGMNNLARSMGEGMSRPGVGSLLKWWLTYIYSGHGPLPSKCRWEGIPQWPI